MAKYFGVNVKYFEHSIFIINKLVKGAARDSRANKDYAQKLHATRNMLLKLSDELNMGHEVILCPTQKYKSYSAVHFDKDVQARKAKEAKEARGRRLRVNQILEEE